MKVIKANTSEHQRRLHEKKNVKQKFDLKGILCNQKF